MRVRVRVRFRVEPRVGAPPACLPSAVSLCLRAFRPPLSSSKYFISIACLSPPHSPPISPFLPIQGVYESIQGASPRKQAGGISTYSGNVFFFPPSSYSFFLLFPYNSLLAPSSTPVAFRVLAPLAPLSLTPPFPDPSPAPSLCLFLSHFLSRCSH